MNTRLLLCIAMGAFVAHLAVFMIIARIRISRLPPLPPAPVRNFSVAEAVEIDPASGRKTVHREFRVSTRLAERDPDRPHAAPTSR